MSPRGRGRGRRPGEIGRDAVGLGQRLCSSGLSDRGVQIGVCEVAQQAGRIMQETTVSFQFDLAGCLYRFLAGIVGGGAETTYKADQHPGDDGEDRVVGGVLHHGRQGRAVIDPGIADQEVHR